MNREVFFKIRLRETEREEIRQKAVEEHLSVSDLVRRELGLTVNRRPPARPRRLLQHFEREAAKHDAEPGMAGLRGLKRRMKT